MPIEPGRLRKLFVIEERVRTPDGSGGFTERWDPVAETQGELRPLSSRDRVRAAQALGEVTHEVTLRHYAGLSTNRHRLVLADEERTFAIAAPPIDPDERGELLTITCREDRT